MALTKVTGGVVSPTSDYAINNVTGVAATFTGNVSIGGTLTYMDVANIDSVGIITAQEGIHFGIGATAGKFLASTGISTFTKVGIGTVTPGQTLDVWGNLQVKDAGGKIGLLVDPSVGYFQVNQSVASWTNTDKDPVRILGWGWKSGTGNHMFMASGGNDATASQMALIISEGHGFKVGRSAWDGTDGDVSSTAEYLRITNSGTVNIGDNFAQTTYKAQITTGTNKHISFTNAAHDDLSNEGSGIVFSRQSDGSKELSGIFGYGNTSLGIAARANITFHAGGSSTYSAAPERLLIDSSGQIGQNATPKSWSLGRAFNIGHTANFLWGESEYGFHMGQNAYYNSGYKKVRNDKSSLYTQYQGVHSWWNSVAAAADATNVWVEAMRITSAGDVGIGTNNPTGANAVTNNTKTLAVGNIVANDGTFKGNVNVEGTLTYEDVTNIDAVGLSTFQDGIHVIGGRESVGIGTTSVDAKLHIEATDGSNLFQLERTSGNNGKLTTTIGGADPCFNIVTTGISSDISIRPGAGDGLIGINRSIPWARVDIAGGGTTANRDVPLMVRNGSYNSETEVFRIGRLDTGITANTYDDIRYHSWWSKNHADGDKNYVGIRVHKGTVGSDYTQQREVIRFRGDGKVGIGSDDPNSQLDIVRANVSGTYPNGNAKPDGASIFNDGGDIFTGRLFLQGWQRSASSDFLTGMNNEGNVLVMYDYGHSKYMQKWHKEAQVELMYNGTERFRTTNNGVNIYEATDKVVRFTGDIGEIGSVTGFQATNTAGTALVDFGMRATTLRFATGSAERLRITNTGEVNIGGNYSSTTYKMRVTGTVAASHFDSLSDLKLKSNVKQIENPIETVKKIDGVTFNWKEDNEASMGVIAQNVEKVIPELISKDEDDIRSVNYSGLIGLLIETVKEQQKQIDELKSRLDK